MFKKIAITCLVTALTIGAEAKFTAADAGKAAKLGIGFNPKNAAHVQAYEAAKKVRQEKNPAWYRANYTGLFPPVGGAPAGAGGLGLGLGRGVAPSGISFDPSKVSGNIQRFNELVTEHLVPLGIDTSRSYNVTMGRIYFLMNRTGPQNKADFLRFREKYGSPFFNTLVREVEKTNFETPTLAEARSLFGRNQDGALIPVNPAEGGGPANNGLLNIQAAAAYIKEICNTVSDSYGPRLQLSLPDTITKINRDHNLIQAILQSYAAVGGRITDEITGTLPGIYREMIKHRALAYIRQESRTLKRSVFSKRTFGVIFSPLDQYDRMPKANLEKTTIKLARYLVYKLADANVSTINNVNSRTKGKDADSRGRVTALTDLFDRLGTDKELERNLKSVLAYMFVETPPETNLYEKANVGAIQQILFGSERGKPISKIFLKEAIKRIGSIFFEDIVIKSDDEGEKIRSFMNRVFGPARRGSAGNAGGAPTVQSDDEKFPRIYNVPLSQLPSWLLNSKGDSKKALVRYYRSLNTTERTELEAAGGHRTGPQRGGIAGALMDGTTPLVKLKAMWRQAGRPFFTSRFN